MHYACETSNSWWRSWIEMEYYSRTQLYLYTFLTVGTLDVFGPEALSFIQDVSGRSQGCQGHWNTFSNESRLLCSREMRLLFLGQWEGQLDWKLLLAECTLHYLMYCNNYELVIIKITDKVSGTETIHKVYRNIGQTVAARWTPCLRNIKSEE